MGDIFDGAASRGSHSAVALHHAVTGSARHLFGRAHSKRYFGGFWFKVYNERGPC